jgi:hypothetical protein
VPNVCAIGCRSNHVSLSEHDRIITRRSFKASRDFVASTLAIYRDANNVALNSFL